MVISSVVDYVEEIVDKKDLCLDEVLLNHVGEHIDWYSDDHLKQLIRHMPILIINHHDYFGKRIENNPELMSELLTPESASDIIDFCIDDAIKYINGFKDKYPNSEITTRIINSLKEALKHIITSGDDISILISIEKMRKIKDLMKKIGDNDSVFDHYIENANDIKMNHLENHGCITEFKIPINDTLEQFKSNPSTMIFVTHIIDENSDYISLAEEFSKSKYEGLMINKVTNVGPVSNYYKPSTQMNIHHCVSLSSQILISIFKNSDISNNYYSMRRQQMDRIGETIFDGQFISELECMYSNVYSIAIQKSPFIVLYGTTLFISSMIEKILRSVIKSESGVDNHQSMNELLNNPIVHKVVGKDLAMWTAFWMTEVDKVGKDYRNRIAHWDSIKMDDISFDTVTSFLFFFDSILTSVYFYYMMKNKEN